MFLCDEFCKMPSYGVLCGYDNKESLKSELTAYVKKCGNRFVFYDCKIEMPDYDEVATMRKILNMIDLSNLRDCTQTVLLKLVERIFPDIDYSTNKKLVCSLHSILSNNVLFVKDSELVTLLFRILKALDSTFLPVFKEVAKRERVYILVSGSLSMHDCVILQVIHNLGVNVLLITEQFLNTNKCKVTVFYKGEKGDIMNFMNSFTDIGSVLDRNNWIDLREADTLEDILGVLFSIKGKPSQLRDNYKCYAYGFAGVLDATTYSRTINTYYETMGRTGVVVIDSTFENPTHEEINECSTLYADCDKLRDILCQFKCFEKSKIPEIIDESIDKLLKKLWTSNTSSFISRLKSKLYIWVIRICKILFGSTINIKEIPYAIIYGKISVQVEYLLQILMNLPVNILHFSPDRNYKLSLEGLSYCNLGISSSNFDTFPYTVVTETSSKVSTLAYNTQTQYRNIMQNVLCGYKSYSKMKSVILQTTLDEIDLYWDEIAAVRPMYQVVSGENSSVIVPTLFAKVDGVTDKPDEFIEKIRKKKNKNTIFVTSDKYFQTLDIYGELYRYMQYNYFNGKLDLKSLQLTSSYPYRLLSEDSETLIYNKAMDFISSEWCQKKTLTDSKLPLKVLAIVFNLPEEVTLLIHKFDFTGDIPKICYFYTSKNLMTFEDLVSIMFLNTLGFDILVYTPSGYDVMAELGKDYYHTILAGEYDMNMTEENIKVRLKPKRKGLFGLL